jgi:hypothetical protein
MERLLGYQRAYEVELSEGLRSVRGRGATEEAALATAQKLWVSQSSEETDANR